MGQDFNNNVMDAAAAFGGPLGTAAEGPAKSMLNPGNPPPQTIGGPSLNTGSQMFNPNLGAAANAYMPSEYFANSPVTDPSAILKAYSDHIPQFQSSVQSSNSSTPYDTTNDPKGIANNNIRSL